MTKNAKELFEVFRSRIAPAFPKYASKRSSSGYEPDGLGLLTIECTRFDALTAAFNKLLNGYKVIALFKTLSASDALIIAICPQKRSPDGAS